MPNRFSEIGVDRIGMFWPFSWFKNGFIILLFVFVPLLQVETLSTISAGDEHSQEELCYHIHGVPKSGTTWVTAIIDQVKKYHCQNLKIEKSSVKCNECEDASIAKHQAESDLFKSRSNDGLIFIFRDTRDVLVSHYHWSRHGHHSITSFTHDKLFGAQYIIQEQNKFLNGIRKLNTKTYHYLILHYETLQKNTNDQINKIINFLGLKLKPNQIDQAIQLTSFENMRQKEIQGKLKLRVHPDSSETLKQAAKKTKSNQSINPEELFGVMTRKGQVGGYKDELDKKTIRYVEDLMRTNLDRYLLKRYLPSSS